MTTENKTVYKSNYARAAAHYLATLGVRPDEPSRAAAYDFISGLYTRLAEAPEAFGLKPLADTYFAPWEKQSERTKDVKIIRDALAKVDTLAAELYSLVSGAQKIEGDALVLSEAQKLPGKTLKALLSLTVTQSECGKTVPLPAGVARGLCELAAISRDATVHITDGAKEDKPHLFFAHCAFEPQSDWLVPRFDAALKAGGSLILLCAELEKRGYERVVCKDGKRISLDYIKTYGEKQAPLKMSWADKFHYGIELTFEDLRLEPYFIWLRMPAFKSVLESCASLPESVADFILRNTKRCDGCRYCVQTDKTGTRPLAAVGVRGKNCCPLYPSFSMNWRSLDSSAAESMLTLLDAVYS